MKQIFKYPFTDLHLIQDGRFTFDLEMPLSPKPRWVGKQGSIITLWAEVDPDRKLTTHRFWMVGTGREIPDSVPYIGTVDDDPYIWHIYGPIEMPS